MHPLQKQDGCFGLSFSIACGLVYKVIRDLELMGHLCIKPIIRIGFIHR